MNTMDKIYHSLRDEVKAKNPALAELITQITSSYEVKANVCEAALKGEVTVDTFKEKFGHLLAGSHPLSTHKEEAVEESDLLGLSNIDEAKRDFEILFDVEPWKASTTNKESNHPSKRTMARRTILLKGHPSTVTESLQRTTLQDPCAKGDKALV